MKAGGIPRVASWGGIRYERISGVRPVPYGSATNLG